MFVHTTISAEVSSLAQWLLCPEDAVFLLSSETVVLRDSAPPGTLVETWWGHIDGVISMSYLGHYPLHSFAAFLLHPVGNLYISWA